MPYSGSPQPTGRMRLLDCLLHAPEGLSVDAMKRALGLSRNAVYQHVTALERDSLIERAEISQTGGRPGQTFRLSEAGRATFPRQYDLLADGLIEMVKSRQGSEALETILQSLGRTLAEPEKARMEKLKSDAAKISAVAELMRRLGYAAKATAGDGGELQIEAYNCVFHHLAQRHAEVCTLDLALLETLLGRPVIHKECMLRGGGCCRFALKPDAGKGAARS